MKKKTIIGAGMAGLITAHKFLDAALIDVGVRGEKHKALLRFRDTSVSELTGIPFKEVMVRKGVFKMSTGPTRTWVANDVSIQEANWYAQKVSGHLKDRSIWRLEPEQRYIAPENFYDLLVDSVGEDRISWNTPIDPIFEKDAETHAWINTAPLPAILAMCGMPTPPMDFSSSSIMVRRFRLPAGTDLYQTIYIPQPNLRAFRASITGDMLIMESMPPQSDEVETFYRMTAEVELENICIAFGLDYGQVSEGWIDSTMQKLGKIVDLPKSVRQSILYELTRSFGVYSVGRFACWRNLLLDDVVKDLDIVKGLMNASDYGRAYFIAKGD